MRIVFFTLNAYDMLTGGHRGGSGGGAQLQQILIGKELAARGHSVYFIEYMSKHTQEQEIDGINVITIPQPTGQGLSRIINVCANTYRVLQKTNPDICYRRVLDFLILPLSALCYYGDYRFVYSIAHDDELTSNPHMFKNSLKNTWIYRCLNRRALSSANIVIAQNDYQYDLATDFLYTDVHKIPNCYPNKSTQPLDWEYDQPVVFWAARYQQWKQPKLVTELARSIPGATFVMAGGPGDEALYNQIRSESESLDNLFVIGHVPISRIDRYFASADVFLNTSEAEGFPNTFLQAWMHKTPVVSYNADPDDIMQTNEIGLVANGSKEELHQLMSEIITEEKLRKQLGIACREYYEANHTVTQITTKYEQVFTKDQ